MSRQPQTNPHSKHDSAPGREDLLSFFIIQHILKLPSHLDFPGRLTEYERHKRLRTNDRPLWTGFYHCYQHHLPPSPFTPPDILFISCWINEPLWTNWKEIKKLIVYWETPASPAYLKKKKIEKCCTPTISPLSVNQRSIVLFHYYYFHYLVFIVPLKSQLTKQIFPEENWRVLLGFIFFLLVLGGRRRDTVSNTITGLLLIIH